MLAEPEGLDAILGDYLGLDYAILLGVTDASDEVIDFMGALAEAKDTEAQDVCLPTLEFPEASFLENPYFEIGPTDLNVDLLGYSMTLEGAHISGAFSADGAVIGGVEFSGLVDLEALGELFGYDASALCLLIAAFDVECVECSDGDMSCLGMRMIDMDAGEVTGLEIEYIEMEDCHEECATLGKNPECPINP